MGRAREVVLVVAMLPVALLVILPLMLAFHVKYYRLRSPSERCVGCPFEPICIVDVEE